MTGITGQKTSGVRLAWPGRHAPEAELHHELAPLLTIPAGRLDVGAARLIAGQALAVLDRLLQEGRAGQIDLVYLDPPFGAGVAWPRRRDVQTATGQVSHDVVAYDDPADELPVWLQHLDTVLDRVHRLLSPRGSLYLHLDFRRAPHARLLLDERFGPACLRNEIVWAYGLGGSSQDRFGRKHDVIQFYAKSPKHAYFQAPLQKATSQRMKGQSKRATDVWQTPHTGTNAQIEGAWPDTLVDLTLSNSDSQRTGYPTQKPLALLERIVHASLPPGGVALDPMAGSGTLGIAAVRVGGQALLGDRSAVALDASRGRLVQAGAAVQLDNVDATLEVRTLPQPGARLVGDRAELLPLAMAGQDNDALSAWGIADPMGQVLAWWDGGAQRLRGPVPLELPLRAGQAQRLVAIDTSGRLWASELVR